MSETSTDVVTDVTPPYVVRRMVALGDLTLEHRHFTNPRTFTGLDDDKIAELAESIKERRKATGGSGIEVAPHVAQVKGSNGTIVNLVIDGQRRVTAALKVLSKDTLIEVVDVEPEPIVLTPEKAADLLGRALVIGQKREAISSFELAEVAATLRDQGWTNGKIASYIGRSDTWVSKILKAREAATPKVVFAWKKGELTDEMFKDIAALTPKAQEEALTAAKAARDSGDRAGARMAVKETLEVEKKRTAERTENDSGDNDRAAKVTNGTNGHAPVVKGPQLALIADDKAEEKRAKPEGPKPPSRAELEDLVSMTDKKPPTHDLVKGITLGVKYALGLTNPNKFGNPWVTYLAHVEGRAVRPKASKKKAGKARRPAKATKASGKKGKGGKKARR